MEKERICHVKYKKRKKQNSTASFQIIIAGFLSIILIGAFLLMLPISSQARDYTSFSDALFTAISATCVTGLVVKDTATYWSAFGQFVILALIQIGGMGVITVGLMIVRITGKKISLWQRSTMQESISAPQVGGIIKLTGFIIKTSLIIELIGAVLLAPVFIRDFGVLNGIWRAIFHSISAFCNAGFDLMGVKGEFSSLTTYNSSIHINIVIMLLIIVGGIGFMTWDDIKTHKQHLKKYRLQSKVILLTSLVLIVFPAIYNFFWEYTDMNFKNRFLNSLFQSVTARTAGFNTADLTQMSESGTTIMIILMLIGGSPGSTAGGMKTTTVAVLFLSAVSVFRRGDDVQAFKRRIPDESVKNAGAVLFIYLMLFIGGGICISMIEGLPLMTCMFETGSAVGTVGLTLGITSTLSLASKVILMLLMFFGRVGALTLIYAAVPSSGGQLSRLPMEKVTIG